MPQYWTILLYMGWTISVTSYMSWYESWEWKIILRSCGYAKTVIITLTKRQPLVWSSYEDSLKTGTLPISTNSPGQKRKMTLNFLSILSTVCAQVNRSRPNCTQLYLHQYFTRLQNNTPASIHVSNNRNEKRNPFTQTLGRKKTFLPLCSPLLSLFVTGKQMKWDMSYAGLCITDPEILIINIKTEYFTDCKHLGTNKSYLFLRNSSLAFLTLLIHFIITPFPVPIFCFMEVATGTWNSSDLAKILSIQHYTYIFSF